MKSYINTRNGFHVLIHEEDDYIYGLDTLSNCCNSPVWAESDICSHCGEHCKTLTTCPECSGSGEIDELDYLKVTSQTITPPYHKVECNTCKGTGVI